MFRGKGNCTACHVGPNFTDELLHNTGVAWQPSRSDEPTRSTPPSVPAGYFRDPGNGRGGFKTPTLRKVARTAPYMHDGSITSLPEVIDFYDSGGRRNPFLDLELHALDLTAAERQALLLFLRSLSGTVTQ